MAEYSPVMLDVCRVLEQHDGRLTFAQLAVALHADVDEVRRQVEAFADLDSSATLDLYLPERSYLLIDPADPAAEDPLPSDDDWVTLTSSATEVLGIEQFDATVLGPLYQAAERLLLEEPANETLQDATAVLRQRFLPGIRRPRHVNAPRVAELSRAIEQRRRVRIVYSRAWNPGVTERVIEPYELNHSSRGAEVDAGPLDDDGEIRTFLVNRIRALEVLDETFVRHVDAGERCIAARGLTPVTGFVPHRGRWAVDKWAERVEVGRQDETGLEFTAHLLPPVQWRCALMMLMAGPDAWLYEDDLDAERVGLAERLLAHHQL
jgi:proteasome accessory factor C